MQKNLTLQIYTKDGITKDNIFKEKNVVHLGCGASKLKGAIGIDMLNFPSVDIIHNLNNVPWPFDSGSVDVFFAHSIVEHLDSVVSFLNEIWRIGKPGARVIISVPYFRSVDSFSDPTHRHFFTSRSMDYFLTGDNGLSRYRYSECTFKKVGFWYGWPQPPKNIFTKIFKSFIHQRPKLYDQYISLFSPVKILIWELEVEK
jgi:SAM-dependent methyltransferase